MKCEHHLTSRMSDVERAFYRSRPDLSTTTTTPNELELLMKVDFKERLKLWYDLSKIARKQQIWDICRVSCRFCLLFDNEKYINRFLKTSSSQPQRFNSLFDKDLMRNLAEAHFIFGEVHL